MNELNEKAINMCQVMIGFKPGVSDGDIDTAISTVTSLPMFAGLNKIELKKSLVSIYNVKVDTYQIYKVISAYPPDGRRTLNQIVRIYRDLSIGHSDYEIHCLADDIICC